MSNILFPHLQFIYYSLIIFDSKTKINVNFVKMSLNEFE